MTKTILRIDASARYTDSVSRALGDDFIAARPDAKVITRDLAKATPHVNEEWVGATFTPPESRTEAQKSALELSDELVAELVAADEILLTTPLYNFSAPAAFKAWVDLIARAGVTFKYTETGPIGLLENKPVTIIVSSGGVPLGSPVDFFSAHARQVFAFVGITDVTFVGAQGGSDDAIAGAKAELAKIAA